MELAGQDHFTFTLRFVQGDLTGELAADAIIC